MLEGGDRLRQRGLGDHQMLRGLAESAIVDDGEEEFSCLMSTVGPPGPFERISRSAPKMKQLEATEAQLRAQIAELEQQKVELPDPGYIAAQARQRLSRHARRRNVPGAAAAEGGDAQRARR